MVNDERRAPEDLPIEVPLPHAAAPSRPRLLAVRPFLWLVLGDVLANVGLWAFFLATESDAAYGFGASPSELGVLLSSFSVAFLAAAPPFGALADRWSPQRLLVLSTAGAAGAMFAGMVAPSLPWLYMALALFGVTHAGTRTARGALVPRLVEADRLVQANGMIAAAWQVPLVAGPALAAWVVRQWGPDGPYAMAIIVSVLSLGFFLSVPDRRVARDRESVGEELLAGFREGWRIPELRWLLTVSAAAFLLWGMVITLEALYVKDVLGEGRDFLGFLWALSGVGALVGSVILVRLRRGAGRERAMIGMGLVMTGIGYVLYVATSSSIVAAIGAVPFGLGFTFFQAPSEALIQRVADQPGRVTAVFAMLGEGGPLVTSLSIAVLGGVVAVHPWLIAAAAAFLAVGVVGLMQPRRSRART